MFKCFQWQQDITPLGGAAPFCVSSYRPEAGKEQKEDGVYYYLSAVSGDERRAERPQRESHGPKMIIRQWDQFLFGTGTRRHVMVEWCMLLWQDEWICLGLRETGSIPSILGCPLLVFVCEHNCLTTVRGCQEAILVPLDYILGPNLDATENSSSGAMCVS